MSLIFSDYIQEIFQLLEMLFSSLNIQTID